MSWRGWAGIGAIAGVIAVYLAFAEGVGWYPFSKILDPILPSTPVPTVPSAPTDTPTPMPDLQATVAAMVEATLTALPTPTPVPTLIPTLPIETPEPTATPTQEPTLTPTATREYLGEEEPVEIVPGVTLWLGQEYGPPDLFGCNAPDPGFTLELGISNNSSQQFNLRFEKNGFHVTDNIGREYRVEGVGIRDCPSEPGLRSWLLNPGFETLIRVSSEGNIGLDVKYLQLTVDNISGYGPFVFRKNP